LYPAKSQEWATDGDNQDSGVGSSCEERTVRSKEIKEIAGKHASADLVPEPPPLSTGRPSSQVLARSLIEIFCKYY
jgi:hypothetical protein